jgi:hypothetical protein
MINRSVRGSPRLPAGLSLCVGAGVGVGGGGGVGGGVCFYVRNRASTGNPVGRKVRRNFMFRQYRKVGCLLRQKFNPLTPEAELHNIFNCSYLITQGVSIRYVFDAV